MTKEQTAIGPWLLSPLLVAAPIGHGLFNNPYFVSTIMGNNAYWAYPVALIIVIPAIAAMYLLAKRFPGQNLIEQGKVILGPFLGTATGFLYLGFLIVFLATLTRDIVNLASMYYLFTTPVTVLAFGYLLTAVWLASRGIETITRTASMIVIPALLVILILLGLGTSNITLNNLEPVFTPNLLDYLRAGVAASHNFYMLGFVAMVLPYLKPLKTFPRFAGGIILLLLAIFAFIAIGSIGVYGPEFIQRFAYPSLAYFRVIDIPSLLLEQVGMVIGITWLVIILIGTSFGHYALSLGLSEIVPFFNYKKWAWIIAPIKYLIIIWPSGILQTKMIVGIVTRIGWIPLFVYPFFLWVAALILKKKGAAACEN